MLFWHQVWVDHGSRFNIVLSFFTLTTLVEWAKTACFSTSPFAQQIKNIPQLSMQNHLM